MEATQLILPAVATFALGTALLVPLRDDRRGRRATLGGAAAPLRPEFGMRPVDRDESIAFVDPSHAQNGIEPGAEPLREIVEVAPTSSMPSTTSEDVAIPSQRETPFAWLVRMGVRVFGIGGERSTASLERPTGDPLATGVVERSFASELASLLGAANENDRGHDTRSEPEFAVAREGEPAATTDVVTPFDHASLAVSAMPSFAIAEPVAIRTPPYSDVSDVAPPPLPIAARTPPTLDRVVPITRLPLRPHGLAITWTRDLAVSERDGVGPVDAAERGVILERLLHEPGTVAYATIERAYHEEEKTGRILALRVLVVRHARAARAVFVDALHTGTDDERALAVEGLATGDARDALPAAFSDRVEAIAARAALEFVGFADRATYRTALSPYVDAARLDALLLLLAGIVE